MLGHIGKILGTRELIPHESYHLVYERSVRTPCECWPYSAPASGPERWNDQPMS